MDFDVFNGDADGILALHQLRLHEPKSGARLITGIKRDIKLLEKIQHVKNSDITVLDISHDTNRDAVRQLLQQKNRITYIDHHFAGTLPGSTLLRAHINPSPNTCTALIVDDLLNGKYRAWAVAAAFGDNLHDSAVKAAEELSLKQTQVEALRELGELLNYNGYGAEVSDLHFSPESLFQRLQPYNDPFVFIAESKDLAILRQAFTDDMRLALTQPEMQSGTQQANNRVYCFPDAPWARRIAGVFSNLRAREKTDAAHALIVANSDSTLRISVRAPLADKKNADTLCLQFPTGGGRSAAAGINQLPANMLKLFIDKFHSTFSPQV